MHLIPFSGAPISLWRSPCFFLRNFLNELACTQDIPLLVLNEEITELAFKYFEATKIPEKARTDAYHLAFPAWYKVDYLLTWNCKHLANGVTRKVIETLNKQLNFHTPIICTPEELMEV